MHNFFRGLKETLHYKWLLAGSLICSIAVASLWSANIGAFFPILEVTLSGQSLPEWSESKLAASRAAVENFQQQIEHLQQKAQPPEGLQQLDLTRAQRQEIQRLSALQQSEKDVIVYHEKLQPYIARFTPATPMATISLFVVILLFSTVVKHVLLLASTMMIAYVSNQITRDLRAKVFDHALAMDRGSFSQHGSAGILSHITHMSDMLGQGIMGFYSGVVREPLKIAACLIGACFISWRLLLACIIVTPVVVALISSLTRSVRRVAKKLLAESTGMHHVILESLNCIQTVQSYCMEETERTRFRRSTKNMMDVNLRVTFFGELAKPVIEFFGLSMTMIAMMVGSYLVLEQETHVWGIQLVDRPLSISAMLVFFGLLIGASDPIRKISSLFGVVGNGIVAADALYGLIGQTSLIEDPAQPRQISGRHKVVEFRDVSFAYRDQEFVISNVNLTLPCRSKVGIVGANGGGKSTLTSLLCRFYDPQQGTVLMDGIDIKQLAIADVRSRIGLVTQQTELFNETIEYNIRYGTLNATEEQVQEAARKAYAHEFISDMPEGYQTRVGQNGQRLSGGQRQRIALARAFLKKPEIMILDEATSQIDVQSEDLILRAISQHTQDCTVLFVTHRPAVLSIMDSVIEVDKGSVTIKPLAAHQLSNVA